MRFTNNKLHEFKNNRLNPPTRGGWKVFAPPEDQGMLVRTIHGGPNGNRVSSTDDERGRSLRGG